jgi:hypothetical protein
MPLFPDRENVSEIRYQVKKDFKRIKKTEESRYRRDDAPDRYKREMPKGYKSKYSGRMI